MTTECYKSECRFHAGDGPFCDEPECRYTEELDQLALDIHAEMDKPALWKLTEQEYIVEFARRYRAALKEKMKPYAYAGMNIDMDEEMVTFFKKDLDKHLKIVTPLYSLKDW